MDQRIQQYREMFNVDPRLVRQVLTKHSHIDGNGDDDAIIDELLTIQSQIEQLNKVSPSLVNEVLSQLEGAGRPEDMLEAVGSLASAQSAEPVRFEREAYRSTTNRAREQHQQQQQQYHRQRQEQPPRQPQYGEAPRAPPAQYGGGGGGGGGGRSDNLDAFFTSDNAHLQPMGHPAPTYGGAAPAAPAYPTQQQHQTMQPHAPPPPDDWRAQPHQQQHAPPPPLNDPNPVATGPTVAQVQARAAAEQMRQEELERKRRREAEFAAAQADAERKLKLAEEEERRAAAAHAAATAVPPAQQEPRRRSPEAAPKKKSRSLLGWIFGTGSDQSPPQQQKEKHEGASPGRKEPANAKDERLPSEDDSDEDNSDELATPVTPIDRNAPLSNPTAAVEAHDTLRRHLSSHPASETNRAADDELQQHKYEPDPHFYFGPGEEEPTTSVNSRTSDTISRQIFNSFLTKEDPAQPLEVTLLPGYSDIIEEIDESARVVSITNRMAPVPAPKVTVTNNGNNFAGFGDDDEFLGGGGGGGVSVAPREEAATAPQATTRATVADDDDAAFNNLFAQFVAKERDD